MTTFKYKTLISLRTILYGLIMGAVNKVPGVSGGIIALIFGFYEKLILSFSRFDNNSLNILRENGFKSFYKHINGRFLTLLLLGIIISFFTTSLIIGFLLEYYHAQILGFFFGMIIFSIIIITKNISKFSIWNLLSVLLGLLVGIGFFFVSPGNEITNPFFVFFCGVVSVSGMVIPGLSGSMILLALGNYKLLLIDSVNALFYTITNIIMGNGIENLGMVNKKLVFLLIIFAIGSMIGLILFSKILNVLIAKYRSTIMSCIIGFISGSIGSVWPWTSTNFDEDIGTFFLKSNSIFFYYPIDLNSKNITILIFILLGGLLVYTIGKVNAKK